MRKERIVGCGKWIVLFWVLMGFFYCLAIRVSAAGGSVICSRTEGEEIYLYIKGVSDIREGTVQIGTEICQDVVFGKLEAFQTPLRTTLLIDNSYSVKKEIRDEVKGIMTELVDAGMEGEEFRIGIFSDTVSWLCDYTADRDLLCDILNELEYQDQETYLRDCLHDAVEEMSSFPDAVYSRIVMVSDGANDQSIGYTDLEMVSLLERSGIPVYTIGIPGDDKALEDLFSFSRASGAAYYILDGQEGNGDITASLTEDHQLLCIRVIPDAALQDGSRKNILITLQADGETVIRTEADMPFGSKDNMSNNANEESEGISEEVQVSSVPGNPVASKQLPVLGGSTPVPPEEETGPDWGIILTVGFALAVILVFAGVFLVILLKKKRRNESLQVKKRTQDTREETGRNARIVSHTAESVETEKMGSMETAKECGSNVTISLWEQQSRQSMKAYLELRDADKPERMFRVPVREVIRIGRKEADILIEHDRYISSRHCEIIFRGNLLYIRDLGSANGTFYEGERIYDREVPIVSGGIIQIGRSKFIVTLMTE